VGRYRQAIDHHEQALTIFREIGDRGGEAEALNSLGEALLADGQRDQAHTRHRSALSLAEQIGDRYEQARARHGLAHHAAGDADHARQHWQQALTLYADLGVPEADQVRAHLTTVDNPRDGQH
jgi:tetratricopeptide (TPR) repeat protein